MFHCKFSILTIFFGIIFLISSVECYTRSQKQRYLDEHDTSIILKIPDVNQCLQRRTYLVNYILYMCFHYGAGGTVKALIPMACASSTDRFHQRINMNKQWKDQFFAYRCVKEGAAVKFKPITCLYQNAEIQPNQTIRVNNDEFKCVQNSVGDLSIIQKHYMHNSCSLGGLNETLALEDKCPGATTIISHSRYGSGTKVRFSTEKGILLTDRQ